MSWSELGRAVENQMCGKILYQILGIFFCFFFWYSPKCVLILITLQISTVSH